jgi:4'-phosphopantetheinyl transferase
VSAKLVATLFLPLAHDEVHLWLVRPDRAAGRDVQDAYRALLSPDERERYGRFAFESRRHEFLVTRGLVRTVLSRYGPLPPEGWRFSRNAHGRPEIAPHHGLHFNLSNAPGLVACAVGRREVGVDVESHARGSAILELTRWVFTDAEWRALTELPQERRAGRALEIWTLKEAYLKARGIGLASPLQGIEFAIGESTAISVSFAAALGDHPARWSFRLLNHSGHRIAVATAGPIRLRAWEVVPRSAEAEVFVEVDERAE